MHQEITAACVLVVNPLGQVLMVSRRDDRADWGLPGGKLEPGETAVQAAIRELWQETGVRVEEDILPLYMRPGNPHACITYLAMSYDDREMRASCDECDVKWGNFAELLPGSFGDYNRRLFDRITCVKDLLNLIQF